MTQNVSRACPVPVQNMLDSGKKTIKYGHVFMCRNVSECVGVRDMSAIRI